MHLRAIAQCYITEEFSVFVEQVHAEISIMRHVVLQDGCNLGLEL